jgi:putative CocE/NonD family hydrolase
MQAQFNRSGKMRPFLLVLILPYVISCTKNQSDSAFVRDNYTKVERYIEMRDGVKLFTSIYIPKDQSKKYPIMLTRTPYDVSPYGENEYKKRLGPSMLFAREGYIFVYQDVRGKWMSEGVFVDVRPINPAKKTIKDIDESTDTYDAIDWLVKNLPANNGRVGIYGISYPGFYSTASLPGAHPALKAVSPQGPVTDWFNGDDWHHNGALMLIDAFDYYSTFGVPRPKPITPDKGPERFTYYTKDNYKFFLELGPIKNVKANYFADTIKFWNNIVEHGTYDKFWKDMDIRQHLTDVKPAVMTVGGFFDAEDVYGTFKTYEAIEKQNKGNTNILVVGPWYHGGWAKSQGDSLGKVKFGQLTGTWYRKNVEFPFFQHYLKDAPAPDLPEALIFETGSNQWKRYAAWPPENTVKKELYLQSGGKLSFIKSTSVDGFDEYISDPSHPVPYADHVHSERTNEYMIDDQRFASRRPDVVSYQTTILDQDVTLAGPLLAHLFVSTTGTDADFVVKLIDVYPDDYPDSLQMSGYQMLVRGEVMRGKFRNSVEKPEPFVPGKVTEVKYALPDVAHTFKKGHRIMVQVQSSWFPLVDRNPQKFVDIYQADDDDFQKATHRIYHNLSNSSALWITVVE